MTHVKKTKSKDFTLKKQLFSPLRN